MLKLSIIMPARNEEQSIVNVLTPICEKLDKSEINYEIIVVNDGSTDQTETVVREYISGKDKISCINNDGNNGFGFAIRKGLEYYTGDAVVFVMADGSDSTEDILVYYRKLCEGYECVFGSRFIKKSKVEKYPLFKLIINRIANFFVRVLFRIPLNDTTNAFKAYRRKVVDGMQPLLSHHFNLTVEMPLKAILRGYTYAIVPISWKGRMEGASKLKLKEMGSRYLFIVLYLFLEKTLARGDYLRRDMPYKRKSKTNEVV